MQGSAFETCQQNQTSTETFQQNQSSTEAFQQNQTSAEAFQYHQRHRGHHGQGAFQHQLVQSAAAAAHFENQQNIKKMEQNWHGLAQVVLSFSFGYFSLLLHI